MPRPRTYLSKTETEVDRVAVYATSGPRSLPLAMRQRCVTCSAYLGSDNQRGVNNSSMCSPCFVAKDAEDTRRLGFLILQAGADPIKAQLAIDGKLEHDNQLRRMAQNRARAKRAAASNPKTIIGASLAGRKHA